MRCAQYIRLVQLSVFDALCSKTRVATLDCRCVAGFTPQHTVNCCKLGSRSPGTPVTPLVNRCDTAVRSTTTAAVVHNYHMAAATVQSREEVKLGDQSRQACCFWTTLARVAVAGAAGAETIHCPIANANQYYLAAARDICEGSLDSQDQAAWPWQGLGRGEIEAYSICNCDIVS
jgi:hypothetical protein